MHNAEWIAEDFAARKPEWPLADFGDVVFTSAKASSLCGGPSGPTSSGAAKVNIELGGKTITEVGAGGSSVTIVYRQNPV